MTTYLAWVHDDGEIRIYPHSQLEPVAVVTLPPGVSFREALEQAGWRPTGRRGPDVSCDAIYVRPLTTAADKLDSAT
jgi:hypothetical protein